MPAVLKKLCWQTNNLTNREYFIGPSLNGSRKKYLYFKLVDLKKALEEIPRNVVWSDARKAGLE